MVTRISTEMINYAELLMFNFKFRGLRPKIVPKNIVELSTRGTACLETITITAAFLPVKQTVFVQSVEIFARD